jgi:DNA polymerase
MGLVAARALVGGSLPLSQLRGRLHSLVIGEGRQIPVIATYHPSFLLRNPEMKKAAWVDLQAIGKRLKLLQ